ncbi:hypothetical protein EH31_09645 [Erythrobacter longus]|uniref:TonB C-terminal domain-containing protein n=1 Tax=Erythrobacter longus TaxID=1044 RepID=A0A074MEQ1_ERYLO|nr:energy transducer TonB [Erythrobacter longus]KEO90343.1 hypothetical protein EH31_09645 [Erythrobacter longus]
MRFAALGVVGATAFLATGTGLAAKNDPVVVTPSSPWNVHYGETKCRLARTFGEGSDMHVLILDQHFPSASAGVTVAGLSFRRFEGREETNVRFSETIAPFTSEPFKGDIGQHKYALVFSSVHFGEISEQGAAGIPQLDNKLAADINFLSFSQGRRNVRFETGPLGPAFEALNTCTQDMVREWGFDVEKQMTVAKRPMLKNIDRVVKRIQRTYPSAALSRGESAIIRVRVTVDEMGEVENCVLNDLTVTKALESPACREMRFAEFDPAIDVNGKPIRSFYTTSITYQIGS